jgi:hypothetical protein
MTRRAMLVGALVIGTVVGAAAIFVPRPDAAKRHACAVNLDALATAGISLTPRCPASDRPYAAPGPDGRVACPEPGSHGLSALSRTRADPPLGPQFPDPR